MVARLPGGTLQEPVEEIVGEHGYWIVKPELHVPPAPVCKSNYFESESLTITVEVLEGVYLFNKSFWIQLGPCAWLSNHMTCILHLPLLRGHPGT